MEDKKTIKRRNKTTIKENALSKYHNDIYI